MAKPAYIELPDGTTFSILFEDPAVLAVDKPAGWMLAPNDWVHTGRNLQLALESSVNAGDYWARSRNLKFIRYIHRLDAETSGVLLLAKNLGALRAYGPLFESRGVEKVYLAVVLEVPKSGEWTCRAKLAPVPGESGLMRASAKEGEDAETRFRVLQAREGWALVEARPITGRTHQIRVHLQASGHPVLGDELYGRPAGIGGPRGLALRAVWLGFRDPFRGHHLRIRAPLEEFVREQGFDPSALEENQGTQGRHAKPSGTNR